MNYDKYKPILKNYLQSKGYSNFEQNINCFSPSHNDQNPSMNIKDDYFKCFSCGITGDIYDAVEIFENIDDKKNQFEFIEKFSIGYNIPTEKSKKFTPDPEAVKIITDYMRDSRSHGENYIKYFTKSRGYTKDLQVMLSQYLGYWPGFEQAKTDLDLETLKKAGIPTPKENQKYSSWHKPGIVCRFENGWKMMYIKKDGDETTTVKRGSIKSESFPYPGLPAGNKIGLVESELSALACRVSGFDYVVSTGGTQALTKESCKILHNYEEVIFIFDGDKHGKKMVGLLPFEPKDKIKKTIVDKLLATGYKGKIKIVELPENKDPDDLIRDGETDLLASCIMDGKYHKPIQQQKNTENLSYIELAEILEESFFIENATTKIEYRSDIKLMQKFIYSRPELAFQEAARLYYCQQVKHGIKIQEESTNEMVWLYDQDRKYWRPLTEKINHEPIELFIKRYKAKWWIEKVSKPYHFKKNNATRSEIEKSFFEYVRGNIDPEQEPFQISGRKIISCKNCVLEWDYKKKKFKKMEHASTHNLTVSPFPFNRLDVNNLNTDQNKRLIAIKKYFYGLVKWVDEDEEIKQDKKESEKNKILQFLFAYIGYTLTAWREKCFMVWIGEPDSGKSTLKEIVQLIHGNKYAEADFCAWSRQNSPHDNEILPGKLVIADDDFEVGGRLPERQLKILSQNNTMTINPKHVKQFTITNTSTPLILTNGLPRAEDLTLKNRLYAIPFNSNFERERRNVESEIFIHYIKEMETLEVLFNLCINIAEKTIFLNGNFEKFCPEVVKRTSTKIIDSASSVLMWIDDLEAQGKLIVEPENKNIKIKRSDLYQMYSINISGPKKGLHLFYEAVRQKFDEYKSNGNNYILGIEKVIEDFNNKLPYGDN